MYSLVQMQSTTTTTFKPTAATGQGSPKANAKKCSMWKRKCWWAQLTKSMLP